MISRSPKKHKTFPMTRGLHNMLWSLGERRIDSFSFLTIYSMLESYLWFGWYFCAFHKCPPKVPLVGWTSNRGGYSFQDKRKERPDSFERIAFGLGLSLRPIQSPLPTTIDLRSTPPQKTDLKDHKRKDKEEALLRNRYPLNPPMNLFPCPLNPPINTGLCPLNQPMKNPFYPLRINPWTLSL